MDQPKCDPRAVVAALIDFGAALDLNCSRWHKVKEEGSPPGSPAFEAAMQGKQAAHAAQVRLREATSPEYGSLGDAFAAIGAAWAAAGGAGAKG